MARKKKQPPAPNDDPGEGHNNPPGLTDEQQAALFFHHCRAYDAALAAKKKADADFKNVCKVARSEIGEDAIHMIKDRLLLETEEGEAKIKAEIERMERVARWMAVPMFAQTDLFSQPDLTPAVDRARAEGKRDGMQGKPLKPGYDHSVPQYEAYCEGWQEGQRAIFNIQKSKDAELFEEDGEESGDGTEPPPPLGDEHTEEQVPA